MLKTFVCAALAACALPGLAETWHFKYKGFHDSIADRFLADRILTGSFIGQDGDGDGTIVLAEITSLVVNDFDYVACASQSNEFWRCGTQAFTYSDGTLSFSAGFTATDPEGWVGGGHLYTAGDREYRYEFWPGQFQEWDYRWTPQTTFAISAAPEPATWALLLAGVPLAVHAAWRRKKQRRLCDAAGPV